MRLGFAGETAIPIFPKAPGGNPFAVFVRLVHVRPASVLLYKPLPAPPLDIDHGVRPDCQNAT